jgi:hypothetical protein
MYCAGTDVGFREYCGVRVGAIDETIATRQAVAQSLCNRGGGSLTCRLNRQLRQIFQPVARGRV